MYFERHGLEKDTEGGVDKISDMDTAIYNIQIVYHSLYTEVNTPILNLGV